jgi:hypothetical protein
MQINISIVLAPLDFHPASTTVSSVMAVPPRECPGCMDENGTDIFSIVFETESV